jgi:UDP-N-acetylglucosamine acyltransferase
MPSIHPTAIIALGAEIGEGTTVGPYSCIGAHVKLGKNCRVSPHVVIEGDTEIGDDSKIYQFASVGGEPQDQKWKGEHTKLIIGSNNIIREYVTIQPGLEQFGGITLIGNNNLFMACSHVAHDVTIGDGNWITNSAAISGHVTIGSKVIFGGMSGVHQFCRVGNYAFIAAGSMVAQDIPPFCMVQGDRARVRGINKVGLERAGFSAEDITKINGAFKLLFVDKAVLAERIAKTTDKYGDFAPVKEMIDFITTSERGIVSYN